MIKKKARLVVRGNLQNENEYSETFSPTLRFNSIRTLISMSCQEDLKLVQFDIKGAFMVSKAAKDDIYIDLPEG